MASGERTLADIAPAWHLIATRLSARDLCSCIQACQLLCHLSDVQLIWKSLAERSWHELGDLDRGGYVSYKALVLDDNRQNVALAMPLPGVLCDWKYQRPSMLYYQCRLLELQWWRSNNTLRLYFDARGEADLRSPITSSLAVVTLKDQAQQHGRASAGSSNATSGASDAQQQQQQHHGGVASDSSCWSEDVSVFHPDECQLLTNKRGHYKGVLIWSSYQCSQILQLLMQFIQQQQQQRPQQQPLPQHTHQQRARRSEAFEEWADWQLSHDADAGETADHHAVDSGALAPDNTGLHTQGGSSRGGSGSSAQRSGSSSSSNIRAGGSSSSSDTQDGWRDNVGRLLSRICGRGSANSTDTAGRSAAAAAAAAEHHAVPHGSQQTEACEGCSTIAAAVQQPPPPKRALVFCYANNLDRYFNHGTGGPHWGLPDYSIAQLMVVPPDQSATGAQTHGAEHTAATTSAPAAATGAAAASASVADPNSTNTHTAAAQATDDDDSDDDNSASEQGSQDSEDLGDFLNDDDLFFIPDLGAPELPDPGPPIHALHFGLPGLLLPHMPGPAPYNMRRVQHLSTHWVPPGNAAKLEGQWAAEWCKVPGAKFVARGQLYDELQRESEADERVRWEGLPGAVKRRGSAWWV